MDQAVNTVHSAHPPSSNAASISTPSQPPTNPPQTSTSSDQPPQQPQQPASQSPAPTMHPSNQSQAQPQTQAQPNTSNASSTIPARAPPGAPGRNYLNTYLAPYLRNGMTNVLEVTPEYPLRWLGEYLISQSLIYEGGTDEKGIVERFIYEEHGAAFKGLRPESTVAAVQTAVRDTNLVNGVQGDRTGGQNGTVGEDTEMDGS